MIQPLLAQAEQMATLQIFSKLVMKNSIMILT